MAIQPGAVCLTCAFNKVGYAQTEAGTQWSNLPSETFYKDNDGIKRHLAESPGHLVVTGLKGVPDGE